MCIYGIIIVLLTVSIHSDLPACHAALDPPSLPALQCSHVGSFLCCLKNSLRVSFIRGPPTANLLAFVCKHLYFSSSERRLGSC